MPVVDIFLNGDAARAADFSFIEDLPHPREIDDVVLAVAAAGLDKPRRSAPEERAANLAEKADRTGKAYHTRLLKQVFAARPTAGALARFDEERAFYLQRPNRDWDDMQDHPWAKGLMVRTSEPCTGYAYVCDGDEGPVRYEFCKPGETDARAAAQRLSKREKRAASIVDWASTRAPEFLKNPAVRRWWEENGWCTDPRPVGTAHPGSYVHRTVIKGAVGEEAFYAVFSEWFDGKWSLTRGDDSEAERVGDFEIVAGEEKTGVWIDVKNYDMGAYESARSAGIAPNDRERYDDKAAGVSARGVVIVNVGADDAARLKRPRALSYEEGCPVFEVPYVLDDGKTNARMMIALERMIGACIATQKDNSEQAKLASK